MVKKIRKLALKKYLETIYYSIKNIRDEKYPFYASLKVTSKCHFACKFCDMKYFQTPDLSNEDMKKIIRNLGRSSLFLLSLEGGEPLLRNDIEEILSEAHKQPFYLLFTTSQKNLLDYPWDKYQKYIDFLHISIDEGHDNLHLFDSLKNINRFNMVVCVQTVVAKEDQDKIEDKVSKCYYSGSKILLMPAVHLDKTEDHFPDFDRMEKQIKILKKNYPETIITPNSYFSAVKKKTGSCSPSSIIIDADGALFYPCRTLKEKPVKLQETDLMKFIETGEAAEFRKKMSICTRQCGWYQYFATSRFSGIHDFFDATGPYLREFFLGKKFED
ncbi:MAG: radical SAM protein [Candidatus Delongbacteria bacterium]|nr:radical SAM protein [Candidatus Delongbacteria bacterium]MCG2761276.1 radical SAM protein [Candidatus Delongbacteria bacterium]